MLFALDDARSVSIATAIIIFWIINDRRHPHLDFLDLINQLGGGYCAIKLPRIKGAIPLFIHQQAIFFKYLHLFAKKNLKCIQV